jgi:hypothetical protein
MLDPGKNDFQDATRGDGFIGMMIPPTPATFSDLSEVRWSSVNSDGLTGIRYFLFLIFKKIFVDGCNFIALSEPPYP